MILARPLSFALTLAGTLPLAAQLPDSTRRDTTAARLKPIEIVGTILAATGPTVGSGVPETSDTIVKVPIMGEGLRSARVVKLHKQPGDKVSHDDVLCEVETDKARATFKDGILELRVPKTAEAASRTRKVAIE